MTDTPSSTTPAGVAGKYLTFVLGHESYGIAVLKIREIIRMADITAVPHMPDYVRGVTNLRGKIVPVVDLRLKFGLSKADTTERTCIVVVQVILSTGAKAPMGLVVDDVEEVVNLAAADIEETPNFGTQLDIAYILGMAKVKGRVKTLLDIDKVVTDGIVHQAAQAALPSSLRVSSRQ
jgi:purine-binding chemotaxis protein CheW